MATTSRAAVSNRRVHRRIAAVLSTTSPVGKEALAEHFTCGHVVPTMRAFADLLDALIYTRSRNAKLKLIGDYLRATPDPDRGWAMAALTGDLDLTAVKPALLRGLIEERVDPVLFRRSRDFVGDTAETIALLWPTPPAGAVSDEPLHLSAVVDRLAALSRADAPGAMAAMLDRLDADERCAQPTAADVPVFRPFMLAHPLEDGRVDLADYAAEWKWDGIRVQLVHVAGA